MESDLTTYLGISVKRDSKSITLTQPGLIDRILEATNMQDCRPNATPAAMTPLGSDPEGEPTLVQILLLQFPKWLVSVPIQRNHMLLLSRLSFGTCKEPNTLEPSFLLQMNWILKYSVMQILLVCGMLNL
jgi:hypothetical protein